MAARPTGEAKEAFATSVVEPAPPHVGVDVQEEPDKSIPESSNVLNVPADTVQEATIDDQDSALGSFTELPDPSGTAVPAAGEDPDLVNRRDSDLDSAFGDDDRSVSSYTTSVASSIWNYQYENGRRYHAFRAGQYVIPNDEKEQDRLDFMHHIFSMTLEGKLYLALIGDNP